MAKYFVKFEYKIERGVSETYQDIVTLDNSDIDSIDTLSHRILYQTGIHRQREIDILMLVKLEV